MRTAAETQREKVREAYAKVALTREAPTAVACCGEGQPSSDYSPDEVASVPAGAFLGEGSGNPVRAARLGSGETVVDLGCGAGMDSFLAANRVGTTGRVVGFDMTTEMLERARENQSVGDYSQVEFREADIADLPLTDASADVVLSNCVINLAPDKRAVYREIFRVLEPGGRFAIADIVLRGDAGLVHRMEDRFTGCSCVKTALEQSLYLDILREAGFEEVRIVAERPAESQARIDEYARLIGTDPRDPGVRAWAVTVVGRKPEA